jgi:hypothetical protein
MPVLLSPTLKYVHLSCVRISFVDESVAALNAQRARTPLETLIIQGCVATTGQMGHFQTLLSLPRALRSLTLLLDYPYMNLGQQGAENQALVFLGALQQQSHSLEHLRYTHRSNNQAGRTSPRHTDTRLVSALATLRQTSPGFSTFTRLHTFDVGHDCNLADLLLDKMLAPPNLRTLRLTGIPYYYRANFTANDSWDHLAAHVAAIASATPFSHLGIHTDPCRKDFPDAGDIFKTALPRDTITRIADTLANRASVQLVCAYYRIPYHAPFVHTDKMPDEAVVYDSGKDRRFKVERYYNAPPITCEQREGWWGPFSGLGI